MNSIRRSILYFHQDALITGSLISLKNLILALDSSKFKATVVLPHRGDAVAFLQQDGIEVRIFPFKTFWTSPGPRCISRDNLKQVSALLPNHKVSAFVKQLKPDLIHLNDKAVINIGISCKKLGIPIIQHSRSAYHLTACKLNKIISSVSIKRNTNHIICISEDEEDMFEQVEQKSIIFNSVNQESCKSAKEKREITRANLNISPNEIVICIAENLGVNKGLFDIIKIAEYLFIEKKCPSIKLLFVGKIADNDSLKAHGFDMSSSEFLQNFIEHKNLANKIQILGFRTDILDVIAACDIMFISKAHGVLGRQPIEAQSLGVPVIAINGHSKRSTLIKHQITGILCNDIEELKSGILLLISDPNIRNSMAKEGLKYASTQFSPASQAAKVMNIYHSLINQ